MKMGQRASKKNFMDQYLCLAKSHFFFLVLKIGGQLKKMIMYFVYHKKAECI